MKKSTPAILVIVFFLSNLTVYSQNGLFVINETIKVTPGEKVSGNLIVEEGIDGGTIIPVTVINGSKPGPVLSLIAGIHGTEFVPIITLGNISKKIKSQELSGTLVLIHVANIHSYQKRTVYFNPVDNKNLNRVFPGDKNGTQTERIAYKISKEIVDKSDYLIDIHGGEFNEQFLNCALSIKDAPNETQLEKIKMITMAFGLDYITANPYNNVPDSVRYTTCERSALRKGIPATTIEIGDLGQVDSEKVAIAERGIMNVMRTIGMLEGEVFFNQNQKYLVDISRVRSGFDGVFFKNVDSGKFVNKGDLLGHTEDYFGNKLEEYYAEKSGLLFSSFNAPSVNKDDLIFKIGTLVTESEIL